MVPAVDSNALTTLATVDDWRPGDTVTITIPTNLSSVMEYAGNVYPNRQNAPGTVTTSGTSITFNDNDCDTWGLGSGDLIGIDDADDANRRTQGNKVQLIDMIGFPGVLGNAETFAKDAGPDGLEVDNSFFGGLMGQGGDRSGEKGPSITEQKDVKK